RAADRTELRLQRRAEIVDDRDDRQRDAGSDQAVLDRGGAGPIGQKASNGLHGLTRIPESTLVRTIIRMRQVPHSGTPTCVHSELIAQEKGARPAPRRGLRRQFFSTIRPTTLPARNSSIHFCTSPIGSSRIGVGLILPARASAISS